MGTTVTKEDPSSKNSTITTKFQKIKCVQWNANYLLANKGNRFAELRSLMIRESVDIAAISETGMKDRHKYEWMEINGYQMIRKDRARSGGGLLIYLRVGIPYSVIRQGITETEFEYVTIKISSITFSLVYRLPHDKVEGLGDLIEFLERSGQGPMVIVGDVSVDYRNLHSPITKKLLDTCMKRGMSMAHTLPTKADKCLDWIIKRKLIIEGIKTEKCTSDHKIVIFTVGPEDHVIYEKSLTSSQHSCKCKAGDVKWCDACEDFMRPCTCQCKPLSCQPKQGKPSKRCSCKRIGQQCSDECDCDCDA